MRTSFALLLIAVAAVAFFAECNNTKTETPVATPVVAIENTGGFESKVKWGEHLVTIAGCQDCHSPKKMTPMGPVIDSSVMLAGHIAASPAFPPDTKNFQRKGLAVTGDLTAWAGPWGTSYTANLTSDSTGIGNWKEEQFFMAVRGGKSKGLPGARTLLPPMPWDMFKSFTDDELRAIFAYLKSTKPVKNVVPPPLPPAAM